MLDRGADALAQAHPEIELFLSLPALLTRNVRDRMRLLKGHPLYGATVSGLPDDELVPVATLSRQGLRLIDPCGYLPSSGAPWTPLISHCAGFLRSKERDQPVIVIDYQGAVAAHWTRPTAETCTRPPLLWCDLANRRKPTAIFWMRRSNGLVPSLTALLAQCSQLVTNPLSDGTIERSAKLVWHLADHGRARNRPSCCMRFQRQSRCRIARKRQ